MFLQNPVGIYNGTKSIRSAARLKLFQALQQTLWMNYSLSLKGETRKAPFNQL